MKTSRTRATAIALIVLALAVPGLAALGSCAENISSGASDEPLTGHLIGRRSVTDTRTNTFSGGANTSIASGTYTHTFTRMVSYEVGVYRMSDGTTREVRCDNYQQLG